MNDIPVKFDHVHVISEDPDKAAQWYVEVLGESEEEQFSCSIGVKIFDSFRGIVPARAGDSPVAVHRGQSRRSRLPEPPQALI